jgi:pilus assembly protein CpaF
MTQRPTTHVSAHGFGRVQTGTGGTDGSEPAAVAPRMATVTRLPFGERRSAATKNASSPANANSAPDRAPADNTSKILSMPHATRGAKTLDAVRDAKAQVQPELMDRLDLAKAADMPVEDLTWHITELTGEVLGEIGLSLNGGELQELVGHLMDDMVGLGPLEPLLADDTVSDILVNGPRQVFVERGGKLELTDITFHDDRHVMNVALRIVSRVGRRVDEFSPMVDARLEDGSRVNIVIPPLALRGPTISIRKFSRTKFTLKDLAEQGSMSMDMASILRAACRARVNILISGGTGTGKTTLLNAISEMIDVGERIITIEDAAELQLQQPHVAALESRPANLEGAGRITLRDLLRNALRMRPDRIILGEVRGDEVIDMLQAMNTGHDGSLGTVHANNPRDALARLENLFAMAGFNLPIGAIRMQIATAIDLIVHVSRMADGSRRVTHITEVTGMEGDTVLLQDLFTFEATGEDSQGRIQGRFVSADLCPDFMRQTKLRGPDQTLGRTIGGQASERTQGDRLRVPAA